MTRIVRNKSIPNVDTPRLVGDLGILHNRFHTVEGLRAHDQPRRNLIDNGVKARLVADELRRRGEPSNGCPFCDRIMPENGK